MLSTSITKPGILGDQWNPMMIQFMVELVSTWHRLKLYRYRLKIGLILSNLWLFLADTPIWFNGKVGIGYPYWHQFNGKFGIMYCQNFWLPNIPGSSITSYLLCCLHPKVKPVFILIKSLVSYFSIEWWFYWKDLVGFKLKYLSYESRVARVGSAGHFWPARTLGIARRIFLERSRQKKRYNKLLTMTKTSFNQVFWTNKVYLSQWWPAHIFWAKFWHVWDKGWPPLLGTFIDAHREGGWGGRGGIKVYPPFKIFAKLVNKTAIKHQKGVPSPQNFHNPYLPPPPSQKLAKTSWTLPQDFLIVCIYGYFRHSLPNSESLGGQRSDQDNCLMLKSAAGFKVSNSAISITNVLWMLRLQISDNGIQLI